MLKVSSKVGVVAISVHAATGTGLADVPYGDIVNIIPWLYANNYRAYSKEVELRDGNTRPPDLDLAGLCDHDLAGDHVHLF